MCRTRIRRLWQPATASLAIALVLATAAWPKDAAPKRPSDHKAKEGSAHQGKKGPDDSSSSSAGSQAPSAGKERPSSKRGGRSASGAKVASAKSAARRPTRLKAPGQPIKLAVLTVAVHTPIFIRAYDQFRSRYGPEKLEMDLWVEQDWAASPRPLDLDHYDMILALRCSIPDLEKAVSAAAAKGAWVVCDSRMKYRDEAVLIDDVPELAPYYRKRGVANMIGFLERVCELFGVAGVQARPAAVTPTEGLYHPDADRVFPDAKSYWDWYASRPGFRPDAPKVGLFVYNTLYLNEETDYFTQLVRGVERAGANPILGFWFMPVDGKEPAVSPIGRFFEGVDVLLTSSFRLMNEKACHYEALRRLDVPVLNSIILNNSLDEWRQSRQGIPASYLLFGIVSPELAGLIEPTVIAARQPVESPETKQRYFRTVVIEENYRWQIRRALAWARLRRTKPAQRRVAILFYNHNAGKHNIGASYLNVTASLERILAELGRRGYQVEGKVGRQQIIESMRNVGRNVGQWAPGELDRLIQHKAVLWPVENYLAYYDRLPEEAKRQISRQWGQPPGNIMTVTRDGRQQFVFPAFQVGNVLLAPQPARAAPEAAASAYHDLSTWPTHQYLAFYFWLRHEWRADAVVHLGRHGTLEFLPGKSVGLAVDDPPAMLLGDLPNIYPYIVDGIGEAVAAKRRGQAVILTHATPPLTSAGLHGELLKLQQLITHYAQAQEQKQSGLSAEYYRAIVKLAAQLGYQQSPTQKQIDQDAPKSPDPASRDREVQQVEHWIAEIASQSGPRGLHTFGDSYTAEAAEDMLRRMFKDELELMRKSGAKAEQLHAFLASAAKSAGAQPPPAPDTKAEKSEPARAGEAARHRIATTAWHMRHNQELDFLCRALDGRFIPVGPPGDPLSNPDIFPTGRNQYQVDSQKLPTREAWAVGKRMAEQTLAMHRTRHGAEPSKLSFTLWANTLIRTHGALESEALYFLGVEPVWNERGDVTDVKLIERLGRPRVDVVLTVTGMYRDCFPDKILLLDKAVRLAHDAPPEPGQANYVHANTEKIARELAGRGADPRQSRRLAILRVFGAPAGVYGTGVDRLVQASEQRTGRGEVASEYLRRMSCAFSSDGWSQPAEELFQRQLRGVQGVIHGRSSHLYGIMDLTENFEYQGGLALAVEHLDGKSPDLYVNDLVTGQKVLSGREAVVFELLARYHNPEFIKSMQAEGYDGARYFSRIADNQYGWDVVSDVITAADWERSAAIYLDDQYGLGLRKFFEQHNPHALQNIASRVLETHRKGLHQLDEKTLQLAARVYVETVAQHGPACTSHICANANLAAMAEKLAGASGQLAEGVLERFRRQLERAGSAEMIKALASVGASDQPAKAPRPVEGRVLTPPEPEPPTPATSKLPNPPQPAKNAASVPPPFQNEQAAPGQRRLATVLAAVACVLAFAGGIVWRAVRSRRIG